MKKIKKKIKKGTGYFFGKKENYIYSWTIQKMKRMGPGPNLKVKK